MKKSRCTLLYQLLHCHFYLSLSWNHCPQRLSFIVLNRWKFKGASSQLCNEWGTIDHLSFPVAWFVIKNVYGCALSWWMWTVYRSLLRPFTLKATSNLFSMPWYCMLFTVQPYSRSWKRWSLSSPEKVTMTCVDCWLFIGTLLKSAMPFNGLRPLFGSGYGFIWIHVTRSEINKTSLASNTSGWSDPADSSVLLSIKLGVSCWDTLIAHIFQY